LYYVFGNLELLGSQTGLTHIPAINIIGAELNTGRSMYILIWVIVLVALIFSSNILNSAPGRAMRAIKNREKAAESFGVHTTQMRLKLFIFSALLACISGWLYAHLVRYVNPT